MSPRVEGPRPLTVVLLSHCLANRLSPRLGRPALPDVLAAHLHPGAPATPVGLLLVSRPCRPRARRSGWETPLPLQCKQAWSAYLGVCT